jgi:hypothetical protein
MTYREAYMNCDTLEELNDMVKNDIIIANMINPDRLRIIKTEAESVANEKFKED